MQKTFPERLRDAEKMVPRKWVHSNQLVTAQDLEEFRQKLLTELSSIIKSHLHFTPKKWMKSHEVRKMLKISQGTLQHLKSKGVVQCSKIGGAYYYDYEKLLQLLNSGGNESKF